MVRLDEKVCRLGDLHQTDNKNNNSDEGNEPCPPEALAMAHARLSLALLHGSDLIALLVDGAFVRHGERQLSKRLWKQGYSNTRDALQ